MNLNQPISFSFELDRAIKRVFRVALGIELFIVFLDVFVNHYKWSSIGAIRRMVNITREDSLANWFSSIQLIIVGSVIWMIAYGVKKQPQNNPMKMKFHCWAGIGSFFIYMGVDDAIKFHERIGTAFKTVLKRSAESSDPGILNDIHNIFPSYSWQMVFGPIFVVIGIFILWFLLKELSSKRLKYLFLAALALYVVAVGFDFVEGLESDTYEGIAAFFSTKEFRIRHMSKTIEEFLEMFGTTLFLIVFLRNLFSISQSWNLKITEKS